jgi:hypothetical protein
MIKRVSVMTLAPMMLLVAAATVFSQVGVSTATLKGTVTDPSNAVVPGARVTARNVERGVTRVATTGADGDYQIPLLNPGIYDVSVEVEGFQPMVSTGLSLTVGQVVIHNVQLSIGQVSARFVVSTDQPLVEPERSQQANTIERRQIENLPNLSRSFTEYVYTLPGVANSDDARLQHTRVSMLRSSGYSIGGSNGRTNYVTLDGGENEFGTGGLRIRNLSVESIQEFQVNRNSFAAEYGFTTGTAVNAVTRSGGNELHGGAYAFYRSQKLAARNPFDFGSRKPFDQRFFPGFTLGGPIVRSRAFFFTAYEMLKQDEARFRSYSSANPSILGLTTSQSAYLQSLSAGPAATDNTRRIAAALQGALTTANFPRSTQLLQASEGSFTLPVRQHSWTTRLDYDDSSGMNNLSGRFTFSDENNSALSLDNLDSMSRGNAEGGRDYTAVGTWSRIFSEGLYNQLRAQFVSNRFEQLPVDPAAPSVSIAGLINYGRTYTVPASIMQKRYQLEDTLAWSRGSHSFKFGFSYRPIDLRLSNEIGFTGIFLFGGGLPLSLAVPAADRAALTGSLAPPAAATLTGLQAFNLGLPQIWQQGFGNPSFTGVQHNLAFFEQDSWKATPRLTLDFGLRMDFDGEPEPINKNTYVSPRLGFAWDVWGDGRTVVRGGGGTFYAPVAIQIFGAATLQSERGDRIVAVSRTLADGAQSSAALWAYGQRLGKLPFTGLSEADVRAFGINIAPKLPGRRVGDAIVDYQNPYSIQGSFGVSQEIARELILEVAYQYYRGVHLPIGTEGNYTESGRPVAVPGSDQGHLFGPQLVRVNPDIAQQIVYASWGNSVYHGLTSSATKRVSRFFQVQANYTFSKTLDDVLDFQSTAAPFLPTRRFLDRAVSAFDIRHNFVVNGVFDSPFKRGGGQPFYARALADITLSPIVFLRSGIPFNLYIGRDVNGDASASDRPFNAPRNSGRGANYYSVNLRLNKRFHIAHGGAEGLRVEFIAEASNLFNRTNFLRVNDVVCGAAAAPGFINGCDPKFLTGPFDFKGRSDLPPTSPLGFVSAGAARQLQFGLKIAF